MEFFSEFVQTSPPTGGAVPEHLLPYELELEANVTLERLIVYVSEMNCRPFIPESWEVLRQVFTGFFLLLMIVLAGHQQ